METGEIKVTWEKLNILFFIIIAKHSKCVKKSFSALTDAKVFKNEIIEEYESVDIIKRTVFEELIL
ncbi:TPA: hypothetical protein KO472_003772 [Clostridioides difficile]|nr:hypothetical protein [Clostridioides difficile]